MCSKSAHGVSRYHPPADFLRISTGDKNTCTSASSPSTSLIAGIGLAVSAIAQPAVPTKEMVVTPFEQVKVSYRSDKAARESDYCGRKGPGQRPFLDVFEVQERRQPQSDLGVFFSQRPNRFDKRSLGQGMRESDAQEAMRFGVGRRKRSQRLRPLQHISRSLKHPGAQRVQARRLR